MQPTPLTGKQRRYLRGLGNVLKPVVFIGQKAITEAVLQSIDEAFNTSELIKLKLQEGYSGDRHQVAEELAAATSAHLVQVLGKTILLYRRHPDKPRIELP